MFFIFRGLRANNSSGGVLNEVLIYLKRLIFKLKLNLFEHFFLFLFLNVLRRFSGRCGPPFKNYLLFGDSRRTLLCREIGETFWKIYVKLIISEFLEKASPYFGILLIVKTSLSRSLGKKKKEICIFYNKSKVSFVSFKPKIFHFALEKKYRKGPQNQHRHFVGGKKNGFVT